MKVVSNCQRASLSGRAGPVHCLNDSVSPKIVINIHFNFFKVLELFECRRGDPYMIADRNYVRFTHS